MINMKSRNGSESDVIYVCYIIFLSHVCYILFSCSSFMNDICILHFIYINVHRCLQVSLMILVMGNFF